MGLVVSVPDDALAAALGDLEGARLVRWALEGPAPEPAIDLVVLPYATGSLDLARLAGVRTRLVQAQSLGYDNLVGRVPAGHRVANAVGVHEGATAELALALILAAERGLDDAVRAAEAHEWRRAWSDGLVGRRVVVVGFGGVGRAVAARLDAFDCVVEVVATRAREVDGRAVHGAESLDGLLAVADVVVLAVPLSATTDRMVDARFLSTMREGALLVNVARGRVVDTPALIEALYAGRVRAALDVVDPEPLERDHPLWDAPGLVLTPHVGGMTRSMTGRVAALVRAQAARLARDEEPLHLIDVTRAQ